MLPERIFLGCGTKEYSATRDHERDDVDNLLLHYYKVALCVTPLPNASPLSSRPSNISQLRSRVLVPLYISGSILG